MVVSNPEERLNPVELNNEIKRRLNPLNPNENYNNDEDTVNNFV